MTKMTNTDASIVSLSDKAAKAARAVIRKEGELQHATMAMTNAFIAIMQVAGTSGDALTLAMRPIVEVVMKEKGLDEKDAKRWLAVYVSTARQAFELQLPIDDKGALQIETFRQVREEISKAKEAKAKETGQPVANKGGRPAVNAVDRITAYLDKEDTETVVAAVMQWAKANKHREKLLAALNK